jgi:hypothetical protein
MNFSLLPVVITFISKLTKSYGQMFLIFSNVAANGLTVVKSVDKTLSLERYAPVRAQFQRAILLLVSAYAEFGIAFRDLKEAVQKNPEDFLELNSFISQLKKDVPADIEKLMEEPVEYLNNLKESDDFGAVPEFIRKSEEYRSAMNFGKTEIINETEFKEVFLNRYAYDISNLGKNLKRVNRELNSRGYTVLLKPYKEGKPSGKFIYWGEGNITFSEEEIKKGVIKIDETLFSAKASLIPNADWPFTNEQEKKDADKTGE